MGNVEKLGNIVRQYPRSSIAGGVVSLTLGILAAFFLMRGKVLVEQWDNSDTKERN